MREAVSEEKVASTEDRGKCLKQFALNAAENAKFHSSPQKADQFFAKNAL